jgi:hypothetical protein
MKRESHNDDDIEIKIDRLRVSTFLNKPPLQEEKEKIKRQLDKYVDETIENITPQEQVQEREEEKHNNNNNNMKQREEVIELDNSDESSEGEKGEEDNA